ncbi:Bacterial regulatory protein, tetR family [Streptomyces malaysiensis subsp. malaysiensis]|nr:Bacterial regulatory protein, tetR family [Streptomyces sp. M56]
MPSRPPLRADARRNLEKLRAAALDVFQERGLGAPLDEVARRADVSIGTLYNRFSSRRELTDSVLPAESNRLSFPYFYPNRLRGRSVSSGPRWMMIRSAADFETLGKGVSWRSVGFVRATESLGFYAGMVSEEAGPVTRSTSLDPPVRPFEDRSKALGPSSRGSTSVGRSSTPSRSWSARTARVSASGRT